MQVLKIGSNPANDIVIASPVVSSDHAQIVLLDDGNILLQDRNSKNGTAVNGQRLQAWTYVNVRRGDRISFANADLQWAQVPPSPSVAQYKGIWNIGKNFQYNQFTLNGNTVSDFHATVKQTKDGKMYITDHSTNGTTVDGNRIPRNTDTLIKKGSAVVCGGVPVDLSRLPWKGGSAGKIILGIAAAVVLLAGITFGLIKLLGSGSPDLKSLERATACVFENYYVEVRLKDDPFVGKIEGWPEVWRYGLKKGKPTLMTLSDDKNIDLFFGRGTAFFISDKGELGTNRHIACPWEILDNAIIDDIRQDMTSLLSEDSWLYSQLVDILNRELGEIYEKGSFSDFITKRQDAIARLNRLNKSAMEISGSINYIGVALTGTNPSTLSDLKSCQVIAFSDNPMKDVALLRLSEPQTPAKIVKDGFFDIEEARLDETSLLPQGEELTIIGYPSEFNTGLAVISQGTEFLPTIHRTYISKKTDEYNFQLQSNVVGGQSGSPIIDKKGRLVGVCWGSIRGTEVAYGCNIKHLKELYDKNKYRE